MSLISLTKMANLTGIKPGVLWFLVTQGRIKTDVTVQKKTVQRMFFEESRAGEVRQFIADVREHRYDRVRLPPGVALERGRKRSRERAKRIWINSAKTRLTHVLRARIGKALIVKHHRRTPYKTEELIGCSVPELRAHFESLFRAGMSWENYGLKGWVIDHKIPCSQFNLNRPSEQRRCFHYSNLQPLFDSENRKKGSRLMV